MRFLIILSILPFATFAAVTKQKYTGGLFSDPTQKPQPSLAVDTWSYYPNTFGTCNGTTFDSCPCGAGTAEPCGPLNWPYISAACFQTCLPGNGGGQQSPINLDAFEEGYEGLGKARGRMKFSGGRCAGVVEQNNLTYEVSFFGGACRKPFTLTVDGQVWVLWQIHFHGTSLHSVNGRYSPIEVHMAHLPVGKTPTTADTNALVLAVFLRPGKANRLFNILTARPADEGTVPGGKEVRMVKAGSPYWLLPKRKDYWHYQGSLGTPSFFRACQLNPGPSFNSTINNVQWNNRPLQEILPETQVYSYGKVLK
ncbi:hypothetical protein NSK_005535 [Nannochloropsis salina CCMP1776]|uniref:carbonic anhydrase n=1 Tax=Nannochloropsis salina CCMP1776 TaxID=1027361 RepID=A0A4D9CV27_9STRA|nr:hypothetical protein NSK_005535 [Nannochloropsis salina CCMP1776]|eukprot:TFJ83161.1 hypothetical protein NSK_005535 [Nannochloropsis salina CCMP1776]